MCRLLFLLGFNPEDKQNFMEAFLSLSAIKTPPKGAVMSVEGDTDCTSKMCNGISQSKGTTQKPKKKYLDGFGFASKDPKKPWEDVYKKPLSYEQAMNRGNTVPNEITKIAQREIVVGHIRHKKNGKKILENTQPFMYKNQLFCHNGMIHSFHDRKKDIHDKIKEKIHSTYKKQEGIIQSKTDGIIQGETDSEYLFYLFLSFQDEVKKENPDIKMNELLEEAMIQTIAFLETLDVLIYFNVIYCNEEFAIITRYVIHKKTKKQQAPTLFYNNTPDGVLISSERMKAGSESIQENSIVLIKL